MEIQRTSFENDRDLFIKSIYESKKGRETRLPNPYTCYVNIDSPNPDLPTITASFLEEIYKNSEEAKTWANRFDKSIVAMAPSGRTFCEFLPDSDPKGKSYVPVVTNKTVNISEIIERMPKTYGPTIAINNQPMTIDAFLITYCHMINELIWDIATKKGISKVTYGSYLNSVKEVVANGFSIMLISEKEIIERKMKDDSVSVRIYGSKVNAYVPQIMGAILER